MPTICRFLGLVIQMHWKDHGPPHVHIKKGSSAHWQISIDGDVLNKKGRLSDRERHRVFAWIDLRRAELLRDWELAKKEKPLNDIEPVG